MRLSPRSMIGTGLSHDTMTAPRGAGAGPSVHRRVHWSVYAVLFASTSVLVGVLWDISWHQTIGRDTFWTPAHLAIYLGGIVAGLTCGWTALRVTFAGTRLERAATVRFWGFRAPLGAWVCIWGAFAMVTSAPFDDWWHNTYGLDVKILSPPHAVLAVGIGAIQIGAMLMALAWQNRWGDLARAHGADAVGRERQLELLFIYGAGLLLLNASVLSTEYIQRWGMHQSLFYEVTCGVFPFFLVSAARASTARWPATLVAAVYTAVTMVMLWMLPLFEGRPQLGPIYVHLDRFLPPDPPLLLIVPAVAIDLLLRRLRSPVNFPGPTPVPSNVTLPASAGEARAAVRDWLGAAAIGAAFPLVFLAVQWPFADFLVSPWARNWVFGTHHMAYMIPPQIQARWFQLNPPDHVLAFLPIALALAFVSARCGLWWGNWMSRVRR
jgi:hypothetical protein